MFEISFALSLTDTGYPRRSATSRRSAFARLTRYSASDIAPAIATAVAPSREKIFWTTLDPTKNPFDARLSAARTTPSLLRIPTVVVILGTLPKGLQWRRLGMLTRMTPGRSRHNLLPGKGRTPTPCHSRAASVSEAFLAKCPPICEVPEPRVGSGPSWSVALFTGHAGPDPLRPWNRT